MKIEIEADRLIYDRAMSILAEDDANPDVGMGMFPFMAIENALAIYGLTRSDIDFEAVQDQIINARHRHRSY